MKLKYNTLTFSTADGHLWPHHCVRDKPLGGATWGRNFYRVRRHNSSGVNWSTHAADCYFGHSIKQARSAWVSSGFVLCNSCARLIRLGQHPSVNKGSDGPLMTALRAEVDHAHTP